MTQLVSLQILRAIAALAVALLHALNDAATVAAGATGGSPFAPTPPVPLAAGVDLFFVISGFVMVYASHSLFGTTDGARRFFVRRLIRIVPLYWLATTAFLLVALAAPGTLNSDRPAPALIAASYLFVPMLRADGLVQPVYGLGWTLNYEMFFYAVFAFWIARDRSTALLGVAGTLLALVAIGRLVPDLGVPLSFWSDTIVLEFVFGAGLAQLYATGYRLALPAAAGLLGVGLLLLHVDLSGSVEALPRGIGWGVPVALVLAGAVFAERAFSATSVAVSASGGWSVAALVALGDASYALYLTHPFAMRALKLIWLKLGLGTAAGPWVYVAVTLGLATMMALAIHRWLERPATVTLRARFDRP